MGDLDDFEYCEEKRTKPGKHRCMILDTKLDVSNSGNRELVITLQISRSPLKVNHFIVFNEFKNRNVSRLFDAFPSLHRSTNYMRWKGAIGAVELAEGDNGYMKVKRMVPEKQAAGLPPFQMFGRQETWEPGEEEWPDWPDEEPAYEMNQLRSPFGNP